MRIDEHEIEIKVDSLESILLPKLKGKIFHVTTRQSYDRIIKDGNIIANATDILKWDTYKKSYASSRNLICLFDLRVVSERKTTDALKKINFLYPSHCEEKPVYIFFAETIVPYLISWTKADNEVGFSEQWVHHVETWHPSPLSIEYISYTLKVNILPDKNSLLRKELAGTFPVSQERAD